MGWTLIIFLAEAFWSYVAAKATVQVVTRKAWKAAWYDFLSVVVSYQILAVIGKSDWNQLYIWAAIVGSVVGTYLAAKRKRKKQKPKVSRRKMGFTTA